MKQMAAQQHPHAINYDRALYHEGDVTNPKDRGAKSFTASNASLKILLTMQLLSGSKDEEETHLALLDTAWQPGYLSYHPTFDLAQNKSDKRTNKEPQLKLSRAVDKGRASIHLVQNIE